MPACSSALPLKSALPHSAGLDSATLYSIISLYKEYMRVQQGQLSLFLDKLDMPDGFNRFAAVLLSVFTLPLCIYSNLSHPTPILTSHLLQIPAHLPPTPQAHQQQHNAHQPSAGRRTGWNTEGGSYIGMGEQLTQRGVAL